jgi:arylsulfatase A-like enzyme
MHVPGYLKKMVRVKDQVQSIDILPTVLDICGLPPHASAQGRSLLPLIKQNSSLPDRIWYGVLNVLRRDENRPVALAATTFRRRQSSIIRDGYQLIYTVTSGTAELFDLRNDPLAQNNIAGHHGTRVKRLMSEFNAIHDALPKYKTSTFILDEDTRQQLETLGYIEE